MRPFVIVSWVIALAGCSGEVKTAPVSGTVRIDGVAVEKGAIQFIPIDGNSGPSAGEVIANGQYKISAERGAAIGRNRVELRAFKKSGREMQDATKPTGSVSAEWVPAIPPQYNTDSTLVRDIKPGDNRIDFDIAVTGPASNAP